MRLLKITPQLSKGCLYSISKNKITIDDEDLLTYSFIVTIQFYLFWIPIFTRTELLKEWHHFANDDGGWTVAVVVTGPKMRDKLVELFNNKKVQINSDFLLLDVYDEDFKTKEDSVLF